jgi:hypothetical protein
MKYDKYQYLYPPRPETKIPRGALGFYEGRGWWAQKKKNGTCTVIFCHGMEKPIFKTRHNDNHKLWTPNDEHNKFFRDLSPKWNVFVGELLHSKVTGGPKNFLYLFDQLVRDGEQLTDKTFAQRQMILQNHWGRFQNEDKGDHLQVHEHIGIVKNYHRDFDKLFENLGIEDEGLVLKNPHAKLKPCSKADSNKGWQVKCRIPHKNYGF